MLGAGELDEETRAGNVAGDGFIDECAGDEVGLVVEDDVDGAAKALSATAGRELAAATAGRGQLFVCGFSTGFAGRFAALAAWTGHLDFEAGFAWDTHFAARLFGCAAHVVPVEARDQSSESCSSGASVFIVRGTCN
jgi:hypothetical protein